MTPLAGLFTVFLCMLFGANTIAIKLTFTGLGTFTTAAIRFLIAAAALAICIKATGHSLRPPRGYSYQLLILGLGFTVQLSLVYFGLSKTHASRGVLLTNLQPFFLLFLAHFLIPGDRITIRKSVGLIMGFCGLAVVFLERKGVTADFRTGDSMLVLATVWWACLVVYLKRIIDHHHPLQIVFYQTLIAVPFCLLQAMLWDARMVTALNPTVVTALLYQALVTASFGFVAWNTLLQKYGAVAMHSFIFMMPIAGVFLSGLVLGEPITGKILIALLLITAGLLIIHVRPRSAISVYPLRKSP
jgi:drug/metabolite transporter (DMT)-like permease